MLVKRFCLTAQHSMQPVPTNGGHYMVKYQNQYDEISLIEDTDMGIIFTYDSTGCLN